MTAFPSPQIAWQITGNHWLALPCIHPADGSIRVLGLLHRGARAAIEFAGSPRFAEGIGDPLFAPAITLDGKRHSLSTAGMAWERAFGWLPTFTVSFDTVVITGTVFAPCGRDADVAGAVYLLSIENRGQPVDVRVEAEGLLGHRQLRIRTPRAFDDAHRVREASPGVVTLSGAALPTVAAVAIAGDAETAVETGADNLPHAYRLTRSLRLGEGERREVAFYLAAGPEDDGARATVDVMRRRGWRELLAITRDTLRSMEQTTGHEAVDRLVNRNLLFAYFFAVGRAIDDAHFYLVRSRAPWNAYGLTLREWEGLQWILPAVQLADPALARELLLRMCEVHGYAPGNGVHYLDGTLFEPGFSLEGAAAYPIAVDRYIRDTQDDQIVEEPIVADTLYAAHDDLHARRDEQRPLYRSEVLASGAPAPFPFTLHGNAAVALAMDVFRRTLDEETAREVQDPAAVRAAIHRHFVVEAEGRQGFATTIDLRGQHAMDDDPVGSALWLPLLELLERSDSTYRRTARRLAGPTPFLSQYAARLSGPDAEATVRWLRRAPLDGGLAAELVEEDGKGVGNGGDAALAGLLAYTLWYAVHVGGLKP